MPRRGRTRQDSEQTADISDIVTSLFERCCLAKALKKATDWTPPDQSRRCQAAEGALLGRGAGAV
jgi:hypothetical protein